MLRKALAVDKIIHEQQLGLEWTTIIGIENVDFNNSFSKCFNVVSVSGMVWQN